ncbi:MAG: PTS sugar transporter subunit IIA [Candidatus Aminicenantes bacterium]|nr:PTS sugar transporter subunit IIA [Candidatus Aminicenantes bacterium]
MDKKNSLDVDEVAVLLQIPASKVLRWVSQGQIPCRFKKEQCYFKKKEILEWAKSHDLTVFSKDDTSESSGEAHSNLEAGIKRGGVHFSLSGDDRFSVLKNAVEVMTLPSGIDRRSVLEALLEREKIASTGIGRGVAIPHPRQPLPFKHFAIPVFFPKKAIEFHSVDGKPVWVLFFMFSPSTQVHLKLLSKLSFFLRDDSFLKNLKACSTARSVTDLVGRHESALERSKKS